MRDGLASWCKPCKNQYDHARLKKNPEKLSQKQTAASRRQRTKPGFKEAEKRARVKHVYGIELHEVERMALEQGGRCKICDKTPRDSLVIDHCHKTLVVRGLLCRKCNAAIGFMNDDLSLVRRAVAYLEETQNAR